MKLKKFENPTPSQAFVNDLLTPPPPKKVIASGHIDNENGIILEGMGDRNVPAKIIKELPTPRYDALSDEQKKCVFIKAALMVEIQSLRNTFVRQKDSRKSPKNFLETLEKLAPAAEIIMREQEDLIASEESPDAHAKLLQTYRKASKGQTTRNLFLDLDWSKEASDIITAAKHKPGFFRG